MINPFTRKEFPIDELNRLALDRVKSYSFVPNFFVYGIQIIIIIIIERQKNEKSN